MNKALIHLVGGRAVARIALVILVIVLANSPEALAWGGERFGGEAVARMAEATVGAEEVAADRTTSAVTASAAET